VFGKPIPSKVVFARLNLCHHHRKVLTRQTTHLNALMMRGMSATSVSRGWRAPIPVGPVDSGRVHCGQMTPGGIQFYDWSALFGQMFQVAAANSDSGIQADERT